MLPKHYSTIFDSDKLYNFTKLLIIKPFIKNDEPEKNVYKPQDVLSKTQLRLRLISIINSIHNTKHEDSLSNRIDELTNFIIKYPIAKQLLQKENLRIRINNNGKEIESKNQLDALLGRFKTLHNEGICILSIDGGGSRGLLSLSLLDEIEKRSGKKIYELFDYISGTSTGAIIACLVGLQKISIRNAINIYKELSGIIFERNRLIGASKLVWKHSYYDSQVLVDFLSKEFKTTTLLSTSKDINCPKISLISVAVNATIPHPFVFRNYSHPSTFDFPYPGTFDATVVQACQASSAAPGYFEACQYGPYILQVFYLHSYLIEVINKFKEKVEIPEPPKEWEDGGILINNPTAIAIHESKWLWPNEKLQCVLSLGNGRHKLYEKPLPLTDYSSLKVKFGKMMQLLSDTETVHATLSDLLPYNYYYRLNPVLSREIHLDNTDPTNFVSIEDDARRYIERNEVLFEKLVKRLLAQRKLKTLAMDYIRNTYIN